MKIFLIALLVAAGSGSTWTGDFSEAKKAAQEKHELIVVNFSGSDWCGPCIRMHKEIFESETFKNYAASSLVLVNADFPRLKKNQLSKEQVAKNESLADQYNPNGSFPYTVIVNAEGKVLKTYDGLPSESPEDFVHEIKQLAGDNN
jgi:thioredoxin-related protein